MLRGVCCQEGYWPGAAADGGSWKQVGCTCESIVTLLVFGSSISRALLYCSVIRIYTISA